MADVIRKVTVEKGYDPRDFVLFAFGGAGPAHAGVFARELGVRKVVVPQRKAASTWCAFGAAAADVLHIFEHSEIMPRRCRRSGSTSVLESSAEQGSQLHGKREGIAAGRQRFEFSLDVRHKGQINEVEVLLPWDRAACRLRAAAAASCSWSGTKSSTAAARRSPARSSRSWSAGCGRGR